MQKEFYFLRHGQTDHNLSGSKTDHDDISLNTTGIQQALSIESLIVTLPIRSVCYSPLERAKQTKEIVTANLQSINHFEIDNLGECTALQWNTMTYLGVEARNSDQEHVLAFRQQVYQGINEALSHPGPVLIVAHGGIHWMACCLLGISQKIHNWSIENCQPVHFFVNQKAQWSARKLGLS